MVPASRVVVVALALAVMLPAAAHAQTIGLGGRLALVRPDSSLEVAADRYSGGQLRAHLSPRTALELALDWRSQTNDALTERTRDYPLQGSLLLYPFRTVVSPYLLGGIGWYSQSIQTLVDNEVVGTTTTRRTGYHAGLGGELRLGRHATLHGDYRYTFLRLGNDESGSGVVDRLKLSHEGSMWTAGFTVYF
jgi:opacity protein-like surface antigen